MCEEQNSRRSDTASRRDGSPSVKSHRSHQKAADVIKHMNPSAIMVQRLFLSEEGKSEGLHTNIVTKTQHEMAVQFVKEGGHIAAAHKMQNQIHQSNMRTLNLNEMPTLKNIDTKSMSHSYTQFQPPAINSPNSTQGLGGLLD